MFNGDMEEVEFEGYRVDCQTDFVLDYLQSRKQEMPFFLFLSYLEPHHQNNHHRYEGPEGSKDKFKDYVAPGDLLGKNGDWRENYPDYLGCINSIDKNLKRIRDKLKELNIDDNTIIVFTSDHGSHFRTRNMEYKRSCHESSIHVPLVVYGGAFKGGKIIEELVSLIDLPPTLLQMAEIEVPKQMHGNPIQPLLNTSPSDWQQDIFVQISESQVGRCLRTKRWKYSVKAPKLTGWFVASSDLYIEEFLYDLENDPHERKNLVKDSKFKEIRKELAERLKVRMVAAGEKEPEIIPWIPFWKKNYKENLLKL
jgi:arylsulfatase A-like enzyme